MHSGNNDEDAGTYTSQVDEISAEDQMLLDRWNLSFFPQYGVLKCNLCTGNKSGIVFKDLKGHMKRLHDVRIPGKVAAKIVEKFFKPESRYLQQTAFILPPLPFLPMADGFKCHLCVFLTTLERVLKVHYTKEHSETEAVITTCALQLISSPPVSRYIAVHRRVSSIDEGALLEEATEIMARVLALPERPALAAPGQVPQLLINLGWDGPDPLGPFRDHFEFDPVEPKNEHNLSMEIFEFLVKFFQENMGTIRLEDSRIRNLLKDCGKGGFKNLQEKASIKRYASIMARLVVFAVHSGELDPKEAPVTICPATRQCLANFWTAFTVKRHDEEAISADLLHLLEMLHLSRPPTLSSTDIVPSFLRFVCLRVDGSLTSVDCLTQTCAIVFAISLSVFLL